jgi:drug/metabolite transporter (DMT)-like permease
LSTVAKRQWLPYATLAVVMLLWSGNAIVGRAVRDAVPPLTLAFFRWSGALAILLPFAWRHLKADRAALGRHWQPVLLLGVIGIACYNALFYSGLHQTTATNGMLLQAAIPALVLVFDRLIFGLRSSLGHGIGVIVSTLGVLAIVAHGRPERLLALHFGTGELFVLGAVLAWSLYTSLLKLRPAIHPLSFLATTFAIGVVAMAPFAFHEWEEGLEIVWSPLALGSIAYVALFPSVIAYGLYNAAVTDIGAARAGQTITLMPLIGALLAAVLLDETLFGFHFLGMGLILAGILVSALASRACP